MEGTYILVVDDESRMRKLLKDFLSTKGYHILEAEDGEKALDIFEENRNKIKLVLLDVMMPKLDGWSVLRKIRQESNLPVIMLTARGEEQDELLTKENGDGIFLCHNSFLFSVSSAAFLPGRQLP